MSAGRENVRSKKGGRESGRTEGRKGGDRERDVHTSNVSCLEKLWSVQTENWVCSLIPNEFKS